jgi:hypothetical protein
MIKFEVSGTGEEVRNELLKLLGLQEPQTETIVTKAAGVPPAAARVRRTRRSRKPESAPEVSWTSEEAEKLMNEIKYNAKKILIELANKPDGYQRSDLIQTLGYSEQAVRGQLSSIGSALKRMGNKPSPISKGKIDEVFTYKLDPTVASVAKQYPI